MTTNLQIPEQIVFYKDVHCKLVWNHYRLFGNSALLLFRPNGTPYRTASINVNSKLEPDEMGIKNWLQNGGMLKTLVNAGIIAPPHRVYDNQHITVPICRILVPHIETPDVRTITYQTPRE